MSKSSPAPAPRRLTGKAEEILDVAMALLVERGYSNLSFRSVAASAGVGIGNLQHYFPTRADLIRAMLERAFDAFLQAISQQPATPRKQGDDDIAVAIRYVLKDQKRRESCVMFWELWALAAHDADAAAVMSHFYARYVEHIATLVRRTRPELSSLRARRAGVLIAALLEGASLFRGHGRPAAALPAGFDKALEQSVREIAANA